MLSLGYKNFTQGFLVKSFDNITINITRNENEVAAITGYDQNQDLCNISNEILEAIKNDINNCNK